MDHSERTLILKVSESLGDDAFRQVREHSREILIGHPNPITAGMKVALPLSLFPVGVVELDVDDCRGEPSLLTSLGMG